MQEASLNAENPLFIQQSQGDFFRLLARLPAAAYTCNADGTIAYYNERAARLWGREPKLNDLSDRYCGAAKLYSAGGHPISHAQSWMARSILEDREFEGCEILIERPDGSRGSVLAYANPLHDEAGKITGGVNVYVEVNERKWADQAMQEADRSKTEFLSLLAHELRNPLAPLRNGLQILKLAGDDRAAVEEARAMMERQVGQMVRLIDELLDLSRIANGKIELQSERLDIATAITDAIESSRPLIESSGHHLTVVFPPQPTYVNADRTRLAQVFTNLLNNSARYTLRGGQIRLRVEQQGNQVVVSLKDNGIGIPPQRLPRIFDMFSATDPSRENSQSGLGIGLSLVRAVIDMHGGKVEAHSAGCGTGSEFIVRLPAAQCPSRPPEKDEGEDDIESSGCYRILVVDDNVDSALSLTLMLKMMGHDTHMVHDGLSAIHAADSYRPDVILLDIGLPELSGYEVCRRIREKSWGKSMVIIAQTGWGQDEDRRKSKEMGFSFHLVKPIDPVVLGKLLAGILQTA